MNDGATPSNAGVHYPPPLLYVAGIAAGWLAQRTYPPATALVTTGIYRFTRNPMYLSLVLLYLAVTLVLDSWWPVVLLPVVVIAVDRMVIRREERYLEHAFPGEYAAYRQRVRRWV